MNVTVTIRHGDGSRDRLSAYAEEKAGKLGRFLDGLTKAEVILEAGDADRHACELILSGVRGHVFVTEVEAESPNVAIDLAVAKMERQLTKYKEKLKRKDRKLSQRQRAVALDPPPPEQEPEPSFDDVRDSPNA